MGVRFAMMVTLAKHVLPLTSVKQEKDGTQPHALNAIWRGVKPVTIPIVYPALMDTLIAMLIKHVQLLPITTVPTAIWKTMSVFLVMRDVIAAPRVDPAISVIM